MLISSVFQYYLRFYSFCECHIDVCLFAININVVITNCPPTCLCLSRHHADRTSVFHEEIPDILLTLNS